MSLSFRPPGHTRVVLQALFVTFLWSTSWILIKEGLDEIPPLTFAGLRYAVAFVCLLPFALRRHERPALRRLDRRQWAMLAALGLIMYAVAQGAQFVALDYLPAQTTSLLLSFSPVVVALLGIVVLSEVPRRLQWLGIAVYLLGAAVFLYPADFPARELMGVGVAVVCLVSAALASVLGRSVNRDSGLSPIAVTVVSMGIGAVVLLATGIVTQGLPPIGWTGWAIIGWLAVVNTAFAFTLWNLTLRSLSAMESSIINNTMMIQIAVLAWIFLDESLDGRKITGLVLASVGVLMVQIRRSRR